MAHATPLSPQRAAFAVALPGLVGAMYALGHFTWFAGTPLGQVPVLDAREGLAFANAILTGHVPAEPFYRAPGYALLLVLLRIVGIPAPGLFSAALGLGAVLHGVNAWLIALITRRWLGNGAGVLAGLLWAMNPTSVHFAVQAGDATPALTCFLAGVGALSSPIGSGVFSARPWRAWVIASVAFAGATVFRPNYLLVWLVVPALAVARKQGPAQIIAACSGAVLFGAIAVWQFTVCGVVGFLPSQGPYNLWAANQPGAHGRYYTQKLALPASVAEQNPARAESLLLFARETGRAPANLAEANRYWRARFVGYITHHPAAWAGQLARKLYALVNDWDQYNNETPAFHIARSPWLRWNPLSWGVVSVLAALGAGPFWQRCPAGARLTFLLGTIAAASALLFFVSARFRLPLEAMLTIAAGGVVALPTIWAAGSARMKRLVPLAATAAAVVTFSAFDGVRDRATYVQDHCLLARAAATVGDDALAWHEAEAALDLRPDHPDALRLAVSSYFNLLLADRAPEADEPEWHRSAARLLSDASVEPELRAAAAVAWWRAGEHDAAVAEWRRLGASPSAIAARLLVHDRTVAATALPTSAGAELKPLVQLAAACGAIGPTATASQAALCATARRLFTTRGTL